MFRALLPALLLIVWVSPVMPMKIADSWPDPDAVQGVREEAITFQSSDPFVPRDIGQAPKRMVRGLLFLPKSTARDHATPAVVMLHGSAGMIDDRARYGPQLASMGIARAAGRNVRQPPRPWNWLHRASAEHYRDNVRGRRLCRARPPRRTSRG